MRYAQIRSMDISNGDEIGISLFTQGCHFHCKNCFNIETWDFSGGKEWNKEVKDKILDLANADYISRLSILGGEPLEPTNLSDLIDLIDSFKARFPSKTIWLYTGYKWEEIMNTHIFKSSSNEDSNKYMRQNIVENIDVLVDGRYEDDKRDVTLKWRGSSNQRVIDVQESIKQGSVVLYCD